jgi:hypothetical protein
MAQTGTEKKKKYHYIIKVSSSCFLVTIILHFRIQHNAFKSVNGYDCHCAAEAYTVHRHDKCNEVT